MTNDHYVKFIIDPDGDNYTVPPGDLISAKVVRKINGPSAYEFEIHNPAGARVGTYEMDDPVDVYVEDADPPTVKVMTGMLNEQVIARPQYGVNTLTGRGEDFLTVLSYRLARCSFPGAVDISTVLTDLITEFAAGEFTTTNVDAAGITVTDFTVGTQKSLLNIMRELAELPSGDSYDFYLDGDNDLHWHKRMDSGYDSGVTLNANNIRVFTSRRTTKDRKTFIHIQGAMEPIEETSATQDTVTDSITLNASHYADDFTAEHDYLMKLEIYIQKVGTPAKDLTGRVALSKNDSPAGDFKRFRLREEDVSSTAGWHAVTISMPTQVGQRYFIKLDKVGADVNNTYKWYGDAPAVLDTINQAQSSPSALKWTIYDADLSMKIHYGSYKEVYSSGWGCVLHMPMDGGAGGTAFDYSGSELDGAITGAAWTTGKSGQGLDFEAGDAGDKIVVPHGEPIDDLQTFTWAAWVKPESIGAERYVLSKGNKYLRIQADNEIQFIVDCVTTDADSVSTTTVAAATWYHIVVVYDHDGDKKVDIYVNGTEETYTTETAGAGNVVADNATDFWVGAHTDSSGWVDGVVDDVRIYNRALAAAEVSNLYELTKTPKREGVVRVPPGTNTTIARLLADRLIAQYLQTEFYATVTFDPPSGTELKPGDLITLDEAGDGLASKAYRLETISWEFGARGKAETVTADISAVLPHESLEELYSKLLEQLLSEYGEQLESGDEEGAEPDRVGRSTIGRSLVAYDPS